MREILFRGKRTYNDEWVYGNLVIDVHGRSHIVPNAFFIEDGHHLRYEDDTDKPVFFNLDTLDQFTGLYDKNGVRVFEGDIVKARMTDAYTVVFNRGSFMGEYTSPIGGFTARVDLLKDDWEVIGNIYDNPELLGRGVLYLS